MKTCFGSMHGFEIFGHNRTWRLSRIISIMYQNSFIFASYLHLRKKKLRQEVGKEWFSYFSAMRPFHPK